MAECLPSVSGPWDQSPALYKPDGVIMHSCNPSTQEVEAEGSEGLRIPEASLG